MAVNLINNIRFYKSDFFIDVLCVFVAVNIGRCHLQHIIGIFHKTNKRTQSNRPIILILIFTVYRIIPKKIGAFIKLPHHHKTNQ